MTGQRTGGAGGLRLERLWREVKATLRWPSRLEWRIARRYLRSRRNSRTASLNTVISTGGVAVGVTALIVVLGVMNGLRDDLRERILVANPHLRILTFGAGLRMDDWQNVLKLIRQQPGVLAASPEVISQAGITAGQDYGEGVNLVGFDPDTGHMSVTSLPRAITKGDLSFKTTKPGVGIFTDPQKILQVQDLDNRVRNLEKQTNRLWIAVGIAGGLLAVLITSVAAMALAS